MSGAWLGVGWGGYREWMEPRVRTENGEKETIILMNKYSFTNQVI